MANTAQDFEKAGYKLVSGNAANGPGNIRVLTPTGSQNIDPAYAQRLIQGGAKINQGYIPDDIAAKNPALKTQDYLAQQGLGGVYTSRLGTFDENQYNTEVSNAKIEADATARRNQGTGLANPGDFPAPNTSINQGTPGLIPTGMTAPQATIQPTNGIQSGVSALGPNSGGITPSKYEQGFNQAQSAGVQAPTSAGAAMGVTNTYSPSKQVNTQADLSLASNQAHQKYLDDFAFSQNSINQGQTLGQQYQQISQQLGIPALDTQLVDINRIINGTEDSIRQEVMSSGSGMATEGQVVSMALSRNRILTQNYNNLLATRANLQNNLTTQMGLAEKDRAYASAQIDRQLDFDRQEIAYTDKAVANSQEGMRRNLDSLGYDGLYNSVNGDPKAVGLIEQSLGLPPGGLLQGAMQAEKSKYQAEQAKNKLTEVSPGATLFDPKTGKAVYTAPTAKSQSGGGSGGIGGQVSSRTQAIIDNPSLFDDLTPTKKGETISELQAAGYDTANLGTKTLSDTAITAMRQTDNALANLDSLKKIINENSDKLGPITGLAYLNPYSESRKIQADIARVRQDVGKALEGGVLRKEDEEKYKQILATITDTPSTAIYKLDALISSLTRDKQNYESLQKSSGRSLDVNQPLTKKGSTVTKQEDLRSKYSY